MAPFTQRQIGYIKAVAGVGQHKSFINYKNVPPVSGWTTAHVDSTVTGGEYTSQDKFVVAPASTISAIAAAPNYTFNGKRLGGAVFCLNNIPVTVDNNDSGGINAFVFHQKKFDKVLAPNKMMLLSQNAQTEGNEFNVYPTYARVGEDFYLESTHIRWRFTMPDFTVASPAKQPHHEYRFIVFRQRKPTVQRSENPTAEVGQWLNWNYDLFAGYEGRRVGFSGHRNHQEMDGNEDYVSGPVLTTGPAGTQIQQYLTTDDIMTMPLNDADYVIMRDERFFLGAEHGKSHYETVTRFDWSDQGSGPSYNMVSDCDDAKNYDWWFLILGTTNDEVVPNLNISVRGTTALTSA